MYEEMRIEEWCGYEIRFVYVDDEWWAILKDICDALRLRTDGIAQRLDSDMLIRVKLDKNDRIHHISTGVNSRGAKSFWMLAVNEFGIYEALFASRRLEARKFRKWSATVMSQLRRCAGLKGYEVMQMTDSDVQYEIDHMLDAIFYDEELDEVMISVTVPGGDVDILPLSEYVEEVSEDE